MAYELEPPPVKRYRRPRFICDQRLLDIAMELGRTMSAHDRLMDRVSPHERMTTLQKDGALEGLLKASAWLIAAWNGGTPSPTKGGYRIVRPE
jgi:hypothetical protein